MLSSLNRELAAANKFHEDCQRCENAFASVTASFHTWFLLVFAGDMWTDMAVILMEAFPATALVFIPGYVVINFGLLNMILAVIVDKAQEARAEDEDQKLKDKGIQYQEAAKQIAKLCEDLDTDGNGTIQEQEVLDGYDSNSQFASTLELMDIRREDLKALFSVLDSDGSGSVSYQEFIDEMYRMKTQADHTLLVFIRHTTESISRKIEEELFLLKQETTRKHGRLHEKLFHLHRALTNAGFVSDEGQEPVNIEDGSQTASDVIQSYESELEPSDWNMHRPHTRTTCTASVTFDMELRVPTACAWMMSQLPRTVNAACNEFMLILLVFVSSCCE